MLNVYISIIRTFHELEPKGVLLERVARPIRRYLKEREDTARIIISSLLTDVNEDTKDKFAASGDLSYEIASEMAKPLASFHREADDELDWNDMNWQPLPSDASPEYKKSKVEDVIWFLLTLWERDDFINELKNIFGDHLLRCEDPEYEKEIRLLEMIKIRLGDDKLQACEVMLRDVLDSKRINVAVKVNETPVQTPDQRMRLRKTPNRTNPRTPRTRNATASASALTSSAPHADTEDQPILNAQILSSFFWPPLRDDHFLVPAEIQALQQEYEARFERVKGMRKLRWMNALGDTTITLELEDRTQTFKKLSPWQVSVIYAFQPQGPEEEQQAAAHARSAKSRSRGRAAQAEPIARSIEQLEEMLQMDESLIHHAITFWIGQSILTETSPGSNVYTVLENLSTSPPSPSTTAAAAAAQEIAQVANSPANAVRSQADLLAEKKGMYGSFMLGMLTNQGNMPVGRILMMMRVMIQGGFPFGEEEVRGLLGEMEKEGRVVGLGGNVWGLRKG